MRKIGVGISKNTSLVTGQNQFNPDCVANLWRVFLYICHKADQRLCRCYLRASELKINLKLSSSEKADSNKVSKPERIRLGEGVALLHPHPLDRNRGIYSRFQTMLRGRVRRKANFGTNFDPELM
jgi:hypothetical protein